MNIEIYTKDFCIWCDRAKALLESKDLKFTEIDISNDVARSEFYSNVGEGVKTVPQVFIEGKRIGGYQELVTWFSNGI
ncbi:glutaredoxin family protein [Acidimicrobiia bacterium]|nr:glutaredoxin family protein [Acidimicrobiia bacterium]MDA9645920.1 glutaredoxin family protein [Candidatus Actinomarina sp.]MDB4249680.1 glutaredoxin family protein [Acidimicrobiia bacterium]MDC1071163.1 glutaredoxin domain-containing protein [Acidimicrobiia bacterium]